VLPLPPNGSAGWSTCDVALRERELRRIQYLPGEFTRHYAVNMRAPWLLIAGFARQLDPGGGVVIALIGDHTGAAAFTISHALVLCAAMS
jgi:hypothetical protein